MPVVQTRNLTKIYNNRLIAVNGVNLTIEQGTVFGLLGPNGAGKTTIIKLLLGLQSPTAGRAEIFGETVTPNAAHLRQRIGYLPTNPRFPPAMTPITYLDFIGQLFGLTKEERKPRLASLIRAVDLLPAQSQVIKSFSTGMTTRLGIAASLINDPDLLIWDEPTAGLDPAGRKYALDLIRELGLRKTLIVSSHILSDIDRVCDHIGVLHDGKLIFQGPMRQFKQTTGRNSVELEIDGDSPRLGALSKRMEEMPEIAGFQRRGSWIEVLFSSSERFAAPLGKLLLTASEVGVEVINVVSTKGQTEEAFIHLLEVDQSDGFSRACDDLEGRPLPSPDDGMERALTSGPEGAE
ncbi:MAG: ABC transporter ATP-binding protein [Armatimonadetes bacterium]|nr:ABC transporter ATP-binding protein [Armatimonadota bacterium]